MNIFINKSAFLIKISILVIGGRGPKSFGRHAARILMQKGYNVIMSSTTQEGVEEINARGNPLLTGCLIRGTDQGDTMPGDIDLRLLLQREEIELVYDASQDRHLGDSIHVYHAVPCLDKGVPFLSEKPGCNTDERGKEALALMQSWPINYSNLDQLYGKQLPMAPVGNVLMADETFAEHVLKSDDPIKCYLVVRRPEAEIVSIMDNIFLHTFPSLFGRHLDFFFDDSQVTDFGDFATASFYAHPKKIKYKSQAPEMYECQLFVQYGGNFTGFEVDGNLVGIHRYNNQAGVPVNHPKWMVPCNPTQAMEQGNDAIVGAEIVAPIPNPLELNLLASLRREPTVPYQEAVKYQQDLQDLMERVERP